MRRLQLVCKTVNDPNLDKRLVFMENNDLEGIATLTNDPLATYHIHGKPTKRKGGRH